MKWFKHDAHSLRKAKIERLIMEYGIEGYGLYYAALEMIAGDIATDDLTFELKHDAELIAHKFKMDTIRVEKIMNRCIELSLFDLADSGRIRCLKLAYMLEESISKNMEMRQLKENLHKTGLLLNHNNNSGVMPDNIRTTSGITPDISGNNPGRIEEKRIEKNKTENKRINPKKFSYPGDTSDFNIFWKKYDKKVDRSKCEKLWNKINPAIYPRVQSHVEEYVKSTPDKKYRKNPATYLFNECWNNEIIIPANGKLKPSVKENTKRFMEMFNEI